MSNRERKNVNELFLVVAVLMGMLCIYGCLQERYDGDLKKDARFLVTASVLLFIITGVGVVWIDGRIPPGYYPVVQGYLNYAFLGLTIISVCGVVRGLHDLDPID